MERLAKRDGAVAKLTDAQKAALAEVDRKTKAKLAEMEILGNDRWRKQEKIPKKLSRSGRAARCQGKNQNQAEKEKECIRKGVTS